MRHRRLRVVREEIPLDLGPHELLAAAVLQKAITDLADPATPLPERLDILAWLDEAELPRLTYEVLGIEGGSENLPRMRDMRRLTFTPRRRKHGSVRENL